MTEQIPLQETEKPDENNPQEDEKSKKIEELEEKLRGEHDRLLRLAAEFENYKKIAQTQQSQSIKYANESILYNFLPIIDNLEMALKCGPSIEDKAGKDLLLGVEMVLKLFYDSLGKFGVKSFSYLGKAFDPAQCEAVSEEESLEEEGTVVKEYQNGYMLHERLLRPSRVVVAKKAQNYNEKA